ncbi:Endogenous retrovirus group K member 6 Pol protein [Lonchura striata]|uniref:RNA-directed DNA polymerase n=1 Tax=Lonchura striata TaxID=40157 RepID=A0A218V4B6_9PASE|nr:Endogenous retrovirus group K member 6 Pol protein [Lonchura striata domestica]
MINDSPKSLRDLHQLCGSLNWIRPWLGLTTGELSPIFNLLRCGEDLDSPRALTQEAKAALEKIQSTLADRQAHRCREGLPFRFIILDSFTGQILINHPGHRLFEVQFHLIPISIQSSEPLKALTVFTDASGGSHKSVITWKDPQTQQWEADVKVVEGSPQVTELDAVVRAFEKFSEPINLVTDSAYVAGVVSRAEHAVLKEVSNPVIFSLLSKLIHLVSHREQPFFVMHMRSHTDLPGFIAEGNRRADALAAPLQLVGQPNILEQAKVSHKLFHQNAPGLVRQFQLRRDQAKAIVAACPQCQESTLPTVSSGVNPRGLLSCEVLQTGITHIQEFGRFQHVHVSVDTFSGAVFASAHMGQKTADAKKHLMQAFAALGVPTTIKTDNGPAYISRAFCEFLQEWGVNHQTGIAHSPTGQAVIERTHQTLKKVLLRQWGDIQAMSPQMRLCKALFTINFLNCSFDRPEPPVLCHFKQHQQLRPKERPPVLIRDPDSGEIQGPHQLITWGRGLLIVENFLSSDIYIHEDTFKSAFGKVDGEGNRQFEREEEGHLGPWDVGRRNSGWEGDKEWLLAGLFRVSHNLNQIFSIKRDCVLGGCQFHFTAFKDFLQEEWISSQSRAEAESSREVEPWPVTNDHCGQLWICVSRHVAAGRAARVGEAVWAYVLLDVVSTMQCTDKAIFPLYLANHKRGKYILGGIKSNVASREGKGILPLYSTEIGSREKSTDIAQISSQSFENYSNGPSAHPSDRHLNRVTVVLMNLLQQLTNSQKNVDNHQLLHWHAFRCDGHKEDSLNPQSMTVAFSQKPGGPRKWTSVLSQDERKFLKAANDGGISPSYGKQLLKNTIEKHMKP